KWMEGSFPKTCLLATSLQVGFSGLRSFGGFAGLVLLAALARFGGLRPFGEVGGRVVPAGLPSPYLVAGRFSQTCLLATLLQVGLADLTTRNFVAGRF